ncbi:MAG: metal-dependent hydrolase [Glaciihabitans sp.]|nr:metal-dependent hydrolase [Glaciihabitans sp.]
MQRTVTIIDSHQHVWNLNRAPYSWLGPGLAPINRSIGFDELRPELAAAGISNTVLVQSDDNDFDTDYMLEVAAANPEVAAVVAWVPLAEPDTAAVRLATLRENPLVVGVRNLIHDLPDPDWLLLPQVDAGLGVLEDAGVSFDLVAVLPRHLELVPILSERHPDLRIVIDHLAKPPIGGESREPWATLIAEAARNPLVYAKISGLYSAVGDPGDWSTDSIRPFVDHALDIFGPSRLMYGGDWPVSLVAGGYARVWAGLAPLFDELSPADRRAILGGTAQEFYRIDPARLGNTASVSAQ